MNIEYHNDWSHNLQQHIEFKVYGHAGKPVIVFPAQGGRFFDFENFGMIDAVHWFVEEGHYQFFTVDSIDNQSWSNGWAHPADRARRHEDYDRYVTQELAPYIRERVGPEVALLATGVSMGGYHSANFFFRHPDIFDSLVSLSGLFQLGMFTGDYMDENVYFNSPLHYLKNMEDPWYLERYRRSRIIICAGQGAWEDEMVHDVNEMRHILEQKSIPAWVDLWGGDVNHDWPWWRKQLPYFLGKLMEEKT